MLQNFPFLIIMSKRKLTSLEQRVSVIKRSEKSKASVKIAKELGVGKTQIQTIVKDKVEILKIWEKGSNFYRAIELIVATVGIES